MSLEILSISTYMHQRLLNQSPAKRLHHLSSQPKGVKFKTHVGESQSTPQACMHQDLCLQADSAHNTQESLVPHTTEMIWPFQISCSGLM